MGEKYGGEMAFVASHDGQNVEVETRDSFACSLLHAVWMVDDGILIGVGE